jgi:hypothetical protein
LSWGLALSIAAKRTRTPRRSLTKKQLQTEIGIELLSLCQTATADGKLAEQELADLRQWLRDNQTAPLPAIAYLNTVINKVIADGQITRDECRDIHLAIEAVLPMEIRLPARARRQTAELADYEAARELRHTSDRNNLAQSYPVIENADFMVAGVRYEGRAMIVAKFVREGDAVALVRDRNNSFSPNAIEVRIESGHTIGFVPEIDACVLAPLLDQGSKYEAWVKKILGYGRVPFPVVVAELYVADAALPDHPFDISRKVLADQIGPGEEITDRGDRRRLAGGVHVLLVFLLIAVIALAIALVAG